MKFADMLTVTPEALKEHYLSVRSLAYTNGQLVDFTMPRSRGRARLARNMGYLLRQIDMCVAAARRRGINLLAA